MTVTNTFLNEITKAINSESYIVPAYIAVATTEVAAINTTDTVLSGEIGGRMSTTNVRVDNNLNMSAIRTSASVINTEDGDDIKSTGLFDTTSGAYLLTGVVVAGVTHTTNFDIEIEFGLTIDRR